MNGDIINYFRGQYTYMCILYHVMNCWYTVQCDTWLYDIQCQLLVCTLKSMLLKTCCYTHCVSTSAPGCCWLTLRAWDAPEARQLLPSSLGWVQNTCKQTTHHNICNIQTYCVCIHLAGKYSKTITTLCIFAVIRTFLYWRIFMVLNFVIEWG